MHTFGNSTSHSENLDQQAASGRHPNDLLRKPFSAFELRPAMYKVTHAQDVVDQFVTVICWRIGLVGLTWIEVADEKRRWNMRLLRYVSAGVMMESFAEDLLLLFYGLVIGWQCKASGDMFAS